MRVIAGTARSIRLRTPEGIGTRPTTDRIKETLFNILQMDVSGARFLDLFAGSGGIGIEALSRGASHAVFVEKDPRAAACILANLSAVRMEEKARLLKTDAENALRMLEGKECFDIIFMDPPYGKNLENRVFSFLSGSSLADEQALIILEAASEYDPKPLEALGFELIRIKDYKTNCHLFFRKMRSE